MASRLVVLRQRLANTIHAALESFSGVVSPVINERSAPFLEEGEVLFDFPLLQQVLGRMVEESFEKMVESDKTHFDELANDIAPRLERDEGVEKVRQKLIEIRRIVQGLFGLERAVEVVAVDGLTGRQPDLLWRQAEHTLSRLRSPDLQLPQASTASIAFDPQALADELEPMVTALEQSIDAVEVDRRSAATSLQAKQDAMAEQDQLITACARIVSGFYLLAGRPDLARRIRLSLRPRRQSSDTESTESTSVDAAPTVVSPGADSAAETGSNPATVT